MFPKRVYSGFVVVIAFLCVQCHNHPTETTKQAATEVKEAVLKADETATKVVTETKEAAADLAEAGKAKLTGLKEKTATAASKIKEEAASLKEKVEETAKKEVKTKSKPKPKKKPKPKPKKRSKIKFEETVHKYGFIKQGEVVKHDFKFTNTGTAPLVIKSVDVSCGCTFPSYPFIPIEPGKEGVIGVTFDSKGKIGPQKPTITVVTNGRPRTLKLNLDGYVE